MSEFHFLRPLWFLALIPAIWLLVLLWRKQSAGDAWRAVFDQQLLSGLWLEKPGRSARLPLLMLTVGWMLAVCALAGPVWERQPEPVWHAQQSRMVILDLSPSMNARDLAPSRLERARFKIMDILDRSREGRTGMVVFAGEPHIVTPLTEDTGTIQNLVTALHTDIMPVSGDYAAPALRMAMELLDLKGIRTGELLLITDGFEDPAAALTQAREIRAHGHTLSVLGIGTELGGAIMRDGITEVIRFDPAPLQELARAGGGAFSRLTTDDGDLNRLLPEVSASGGFEQISGSAGGIERWVEQGVWLLPVIVLLAAVAFRRGWLLGCAVFFITPPPVHAFGWQDLWLRADQQAYRYLQQDDPQTAAQQFRNPDWRGMALYEAGDYEAAAQAFAESNDPAARYNRGNALARAGEIEQAIEAYRAVLQENPAHDDARANLELLEDLLQDQQQDGESQQQHDEENQHGNGEDEQKDNAERNEENGSKGDSEQSDMMQTEDEAQNGKNGTNGDNDDQRADDEQYGSQLSDAPQPDHDDQHPDAQQDEQQDAQLNASTPDDASDAHDMLPSEEDLALEQWLRQIPEDPSGLLRRKFMLEHHQRKQR
ncbi:VWA domain-containing protein [Nitrosomonas sp. Nm51]|uniref:VWA domain-containing protein n=1 Tax=Nitrosomonas sp. Nm51 TaxID=133720 RepID=UPI0015A6E841|nr:VWA domain-containing protein [Nitrosomonas sp. Nm51]